MLYVVFPPRFNIFPFRFHLRNQVISSCERDYYYLADTNFEGKNTVESAFSLFTAIESNSVACSRTDMRGN